MRGFFVVLAAAISTQAGAVSAEQAPDPQPPLVMFQRYVSVTTPLVNIAQDAKMVADCGLRSKRWNLDIEKWINGRAMDVAENIFGPIQDGKGPGYQAIMGFAQRVNAAERAADASPPGNCEALVENYDVASLDKLAEAIDPNWQQ